MAGGASGSVALDTNAAIIAGSTVGAALLAAAGFATAVYLRARRTTTAPPSPTTTTVMLDKAAPTLAPAPEARRSQGSDSGDSWSKPSEQFGGNPDDAAARRYSDPRALPAYAPDWADSTSRAPGISASAIAMHLVNRGSGGGRRRVARSRYRRVATTRTIRLCTCTDDGGGRHYCARPGSAPATASAGGSRCAPGRRTAVTAGGDIAVARAGPGTHASAQHSVAALARGGLGRTGTSSSYFGPRRCPDTHGIYADAHHLDRAGPAARGQAPFLDGDAVQRRWRCRRWR